MNKLPSPHRPEDRKRRRWRRRVMRVILWAAVCTCVLVLVVLVILPVYPRPGESAKRTICASQLAQIGVALRAYSDRYGCLPPAYIVDSKGQRLYSWRVLVLPYLECFDEYKQFRRDEPWDNEHNKAVIDAVDARGIFRCPAADDPRVKRVTGETNYVMLVGPGAISDGPHCTKLRDIHRDVKSIIMVGEVYGTRIIWSEPADLRVTEMSFRVNDSVSNAIRSHHPGGANVLMCDGSVKFLENAIDATTLERMTTVRDGGSGSAGAARSNGGPATEGK